MTNIQTSFRSLVIIQSKQLAADRWDCFAQLLELTYSNSGLQPKEVIDFLAAAVGENMVKGEADSIDTLLAAKVLSKFNSKNNPNNLEYFEVFIEDGKLGWRFTNK